MKTNDLKKGAKIVLNNGWKATIADNMRGNTRMAKVEGFVTETGSIYAHDISAYLDESSGEYKFDIELTPSQMQLQKQIEFLI